MIRVVLVGWSSQDWRVYRQAQWMAEVRRSPEAGQLPRHHFDIGEDGYRLALSAWNDEGAAASFEAAASLLRRQGASEVMPP